MKKFILLFISILSVMADMSSCVIKSKAKDDKNLKITVLVDESDSERVKECGKSLMKRIEAFADSSAEMRINADTIEFCMKLENQEDTVSLRKMLLSEGGCGIWECIATEDINKYMNSLYSRCDSLTDLIQKGTSDMGSVIGYVNLTDTSKVNGILSSEKANKTLPDDYVFAWSAKPISEKEELMELFALKFNGDEGPSLGGGHIKATEAKIEYGMSCVSMKLDEEGANLFYELTNKNVSRQLAIVVDNKVYTSPMVNAPIKGGNVSITGDLTLSEAKALAAIISSEPIKSKITVDNIQSLQ